MHELHAAIVAIGQKAAVSIWKAAGNHYQKIRKEQQAELVFLRKKNTKAEATINALRAELEQLQMEKQKLEQMLIFHLPVSSAIKPDKNTWQIPSYQIKLHMLENNAVERYILKSSPKVNP